MHRAVQHFHAKELVYKIFYYILSCLILYIFFSQQEASSRVSDTGEIWCLRLLSLGFGFQKWWNSSTETEGWMRETKPIMVCTEIITSKSTNYCTMICACGLWLVWSMAISTFWTEHIFIQKKGQAWVWAAHGRAEVQRNHSSHTCFVFCLLFVCGLTVLVPG